LSSAFVVVFVVTNAVGIVSFGYGTSGLQKTVGFKPRKDGVLVLTTTVIQKYYIKKKKTETSPSPAISIKSLPYQIILEVTY
jgi:hypothetical protein